MKTLIHAAVITFAFYLCMGMSSNEVRSTAQLPSAQTVQGRSLLNPFYDSALLARYRRKAGQN